MSGKYLYYVVVYDAAKDQWYIDGEERMCYAGGWVNPNSDPKLREEFFARWDQLSNVLALQSSSTNQAKEQS
jgi:hypothetical protein